MPMAGNPLYLISLSGSSLSELLLGGLQSLSFPSSRCGANGLGSIEKGWEPRLLPSTRPDPWVPHGSQARQLQGSDAQGPYQAPIRQGQQWRKGATPSRPSISLDLWPLPRLLPHLKHGKAGPSAIACPVWLGHGGSQGSNPSSVTLGK